MTTVTSLGAASGMDLEGLLTKLMSAESTHLDSLQTQQSTYNSEISAYGQLKSALDSFNTATQALQDSWDFDGTTATSSNTSAFTATAADGASTGTHTVAVNNLAQQQIQYSKDAAFSSTTTAMGTSTVSGSSSLSGSDTLTFTLAGDSTKTFSVTANYDTDSLETLKNSINSASGNTFLTASILNDGSGNRLVVTAKDTGLSNGINVSESQSGSPLNFTTSQAAKDASLTVDGIAVTSASNTVTNVVDGVTLSLQGTTSSAASLVVAHDVSGITTKVQSFISAYNNLTSAANTLHKKGATLDGENTVTQVITQLQSVFNTPANISGNSYSYMAQLGITFSKDGTLSLDTSTFQNALSTNFSQVVSAFTDVKEGFAQRLSQTATAMMNTNGLLSARIDGLNTSLTNIGDDITREETRLSNVSATYRAQFSALDTLVGNLNTSLSYISQLTKSTSSS